MERLMSSEERIRKAEEIYNRRKMQGGVRVSTTNVTGSYKDKYKLYKKLIKQIIVCFIIYIVFYLVKSSNYIFSEEFISKTKEYLSYDINFTNIYNSFVDYYNNNLQNLFNIKKDNDNENTSNEINYNEINENQEDLTGGIGGGVDENVIVEDNISINENEELSQMDLDAKEIMENYNFILPLKGTVSSRYGPREGNSIVSSNHAGIDIAADEGTIFVAAISGVVISSSSEGSYGKHLYIQNDDVITVYAHCKTLYVKEGDYIELGQQLGEVGQTGNATGPHLHFEIRKENRTVNPELILEFE